MHEHKAWIVKNLSASCREMFAQCSFFKEINQAVSTFPSAITHHHLCQGSVKKRYKVTLKSYIESTGQVALLQKSEVHEIVSGTGTVV